MVSQLLCQELGYEDVNEFEDAIQGEFKDFLTVMPHIETREELPGAHLPFFILRAALEIA